MNANSLWTGNDYAYYRWIGNDKYHDKAERVRIVKIIKKQLSGNNRLSAYAVVLSIDDDGEILYDARTKEVRVRDIFARWEDYEDERERKNIERNREEREREERYRQMEEERERRRQAEKAERDKLYEALEEKGIPRSAVTFSYDNIIINRKALEEFLWPTTHEQSVIQNQH